MGSTSERSPAALSGLTVGLLPVLAGLLCGCATVGSGAGDVTELDVLDLPISITTRDDDRERATAATLRAFAAATRTGKLLLANRETSQIGLLNQIPADMTLPLLPQTYSALKHALAIARITGGAYDPARRRMLMLWGLIDGTPHVPRQRQIDRVLRRANWRKIELTERGATAARKTAAALVDLEGIAVGEMLDAALVTLKRAGVPAALVRSGGISSFYSAPDGEPWQLPVLAEDSSGAGARVATVTLRAGGFAAARPEHVTLAEDGTRIHEWIDPRSGRPVEGTRAAAASARNAGVAAGYAAAAFALGAEAPALLGPRPVIQWLVLLADGQRFTSEALSVEWHER